MEHAVQTTGATSKKQWGQINVINAKDLARKLKDKMAEPAQFIYRSLSDNTRTLIENGEFEKITESLTRDLRNIIHDGWIYEKSRFPNASTDIIAEKLMANPDNYRLAELNHLLLTHSFPEEIESPKEHSLTEIADLLSRDPENFKINDFPIAAPVVYWFVDGVSHAGIHLPEENWEKLCKFASKEFNRQRSLVVAKHDAMMDPVAMGMAACLCARLRNKGTGLSKDIVSTLPSMVELDHSIKELFRHQTESGIWPKYFPMFNYQEAGSNFCFTFELLEAVLHEFGEISNELLDDSAIICGLEKAVKWCEVNRHPLDEIPFGWNSGGDLKTLQKEQSESWATAVIHMFLCELSNVFSHHIQQRILQTYKADPRPEKPSDKNIDRLLDVDLFMPGQKTTLLKLLKETLVLPNKRRTEADLRRNGIKSPMSALLFGPPGTSKTRLTRAIAEALGWPRIVINPLANVYFRADEIFRDLRELSAVVVFFDEMDALTQNRDQAGARLDTATQFLTTSMLPHLTDLHDKGRVVFIMATNFQAEFDMALKRAGRFDFLLCMGPPDLTEKLNKLTEFFEDKQLVDEQAERAKAAIDKYVAVNSRTRYQLDLYTFGEFKAFLGLCGTGKDIGAELETMGQQGFLGKIEEYSKNVQLKMDELPDAFQNKLPTWDELIKDMKKDDLNTYLRREIVRYVRDRNGSRKQY